MTRVARGLLAFVLVAGVGGAAVAAEPEESKRLGEAKDCIAEERWSRAIELLRQTVADPKEPGRDEALYWLAHSLNEYGDSAAALETIRRLETEYRTSAWLKPAGALRILMAVRLGRQDVLWFTVAPPPPPAAPAPPVPAAGKPTRAPKAPPVPAPAGQPTVPVPPAPPAPPAPASYGAPPPPPPKLWVPDGFIVDQELKLQALSSLMKSDADRVLPMLLEIAMDGGNPGQASRAVFVMAQSGRPEARRSVIEVAYKGVEPVRIAAIRELGRLEGPEISGELIQVYSTGQEGVKRQVVKSLGERRERIALMRIAQSEKQPELRSRAILTLGQIGGSEQLKLLYGRVGPETRRAVILGLFNARADADLIQIAERERSLTLRREIYTQLRLLGTPRAKEYLVKVDEQR
jgi:HEAT repeat protein